MSAKNVSNTASQRILAEQLSGEHISRRVRFILLDDAHETVRVIEGELRQIYHVGGEVNINIGLGAEEEYRLDHGACVLLDPAQSIDSIIWE